MKDIKNIMDNALNEFLKTISLTMALKFWYNSACNVENPDNINWEKIHSDLKPRLAEPLAWNLTGLPTTIKELEDMCSATIFAEISNSAWYKYTCAGCKEVHYLTYNDVCFYIEKGFTAPKRCKSCRSVRNKI